MIDNIKNNLPKIKLSSDTLKIIAVVTMMIDHSAFCLLHYYMTMFYMDIVPQTYTKLNNVYEFCRGVGRISFPIFCFFLVEGFFRTKNVWKHLLRLGIFAIISEVPFDLAHFKVILEWTHQNVIVELFLGFLMLILLRYIEDIPGLSDVTRMICICCAVFAFADLATICKVDYSFKGIMLIAVLYILRSVKEFRLLAGAAVTSIAKYAPIAFVLLYFYDPDTKPRLKYFFYAFYPVHLFMIYLLGALLFR